MNKKYLGAMVDCSRNSVMKPQAVKLYINALEKMGYNMLMLYTEDTYEMPKYPMFGYLRGGYTKDELKDITVYGKAHGIELVPCIQTLGHLERILKWKHFSDVRDTSSVLLVGEEKTYELIEEMFKTARECFDTDIIHIGMDEAEDIGSGKYLEKYGYDPNRFRIMKMHLDRVAALAEKYGFTPLIWSDMFFKFANNGNYFCKDPKLITKEICNSVPENIQLVYWDYNTESKEHCDCMLECHKRFNNAIWYAGGAHTGNGLAPHNMWSVNNNKNALLSCREQGVDNVIITCWGDDGGDVSRFSALPALFAAAEQYRGNFDDELIKEKFFAAFGISFDDFLKLDYPTQKYPDGKFYQQNPQKTILFGDPFCSVFDFTLKEDELELYRNTYKSHAAELEPLCACKEYGHLFRNAKALCEIMELKTGLCRKIRTAYRNNDKTELELLADTCVLLSQKVQSYYNVLRECWYYENKPQGFEIEDIRFGGLKQRLVNCADMLKDYVCGKLDSLPEVEQKLMSIYSEYWGSYFFSWTHAVSVNRIDWGTI